MTGYLKEIVFFIIFQGLLLKLVNDEDYKKMIKVCCGIILVIMLIRPIDMLLGTGSDTAMSLSGMIKNFFNNIEADNGSSGLKDAIEAADRDSEKRLKEDYEKLLREQIDDMVKEYGYSAGAVLVTIDESRNNLIGGMEVYLSKKGAEAGADNKRPTEKIEDVERIEVNISITDKEESENPIKTEPPDIMAIKNKLVDTYGVDYGRINIYYEV